MKFFKSSRKSRIKVNDLEVIAKHVAALLTHQLVKNGKKSIKISSIF